MLFIPFLGSVHLFDWDEINFAEASREFIETGDYFTVRIDFQPFHEKPPLFFWIQAFSMKVFGINEFAARFPNAVIGIISLLVLFNIGLKINGREFGWIWVMAYFGSLLPHFYFRSAIIDPVFNLFIFLAMYYLWKYYNDNAESPKTLMTAGVFMGMSVLTKGPAGVLLIFLAWFGYWIINRKEIQFPLKPGLIFSAFAHIPFGIWFLIIVVSGADPEILVQFITYQFRLVSTQDAGHGGPFYYHFIVILFGCFPASVFIFGSLFKKQNNDNRENDFRVWNLLLLGTVLLIFSFVQTKIVHYSSLAYFPVTYLAALTIFGLINENTKSVKKYTWLLGAIGIVISISLFMVAFLMMNIDILLKMVKDEFTKTVVSSEVAWGGYEQYVGVFYLTIVMVSVYLLRSGKLKHGFTSLFIGSAISISGILIIIAPRIEAYTQNAPIEFWKSLSNKDCYVNTLGYKSYSHYFYAQKKEKNSAYGKKMTFDEFRDWMLTGDIDKPAYFSAKYHHAKSYLEEYNLTELYTKNGFTFMKRGIPKKE